MWLKEANSLQRRLGELRDATPAEAGIWTRWTNGKIENDDSSVKYNLFQAGFDKDSEGVNEKTYRGFAVSHAKGDGSYELGNGDLSETSLSLYQTGIRSNGAYYDIIAKVGKYINDYDITDTANVSGGDYNTWAYSISGEYGIRKNLGAGLYVEPQAELILGRIGKANYTTKTGMDVELDAQNKFISRLGIAVGKTFTAGNIYALASYYHDFGTGVDLTAAADGQSVGYSNDSARNWCELSLGGNVKAGKNCNIYGEVSKSLGQLTSNAQINLGVRWSF
jgi:outer membrane autotransporter protein